MKPPVVLALVAHPDDMEFVMAGTLLRLKDCGATLHICNLADGGCGGFSGDYEATARIRRHEAEASAARLGATFHPPLTRDLEIIYTSELLIQVAALIRQVNPSILLTHALSDYMEDHMATARLAVTAAFVKGMPHFITRPAQPPVPGEIAVYHAQPHGNRDELNRLVTPDCVIDISDLIDRKAELLGCHVSQNQWLSQTQGMNALAETMKNHNHEVGQWAGVAYGEGWRRHNPQGLSGPNFDPLKSWLKDYRHCGD